MVETSTASVAFRHRSLPTFGPTVSTLRISYAVAEALLQPAFDRIGGGARGVVAGFLDTDLELASLASDVLYHHALQLGPVERGTHVADRSRLRESARAPSYRP